MGLFLRILVFFCAISLASGVLVRLFNVEFGSTSFWQDHGLFFLLFITLFPRLTLLLSNVISGGFIWWIAWIFAPRILVATLATISYWQTNPILVVISWLIAWGGETSEKYFVTSRRNIYRYQPEPNATVIDVEAR